MKKYIKVKVWKQALGSALPFPILVFIFVLLRGGDSSIIFYKPLLILIVLSAVLFGIIGAVAAVMSIESVMINDEIKAISSFLGRGTVKLSNAKICFGLHPLFIVIKDNSNKSVVRIPRPFWADDPSLVKEILDKIKNNSAYNQEAQVDSQGTRI